MPILVYNSFKKNEIALYINRHKIGVKAPMIEWILIIILVAFLVYRLTPAKDVKTITAQELKSVLYDPDKVFIDVRSPIEYNAQHIQQFQNIPLKSKFKDLPKDKEIVVICQTGIRSNQACKKLKRRGHKNITNVRGGLSHWNFKGEK